MLSDQNKATLARFGVEDPGSVAEFRSSREGMGNLLDAAREEGRQSAGDRVKALEEQVRVFVSLETEDNGRRFPTRQEIATARALLAPQAAPVEQGAMPEPPWEATSLGANNAKREGWKAHFEGRAREACPFPAGRDDLQRGYRIGWDTAADQKDGAS